MLTKKQYEQYKLNHQNMWDWLAQNPWNDKENYFETFPEQWSEDLAECCYCFACLVGENITGSFCKLCPLTKSCLDGYNRYLDAQDEGKILKAEDYAQQVADIPWLDYEKWAEIWRVHHAE